jgi:hypothetical protein
VAFTAIIKANNDNLVLKKMAGQALQSLLKRAVLPTLVTRAEDLDPKPREVGDTIKCAVFGALQSTIKPENASSDFQGVDPSVVQIVVNQHLEVPVRIGELAQLFCTPSMAASCAVEIGQSLARRLDSLLAALYTSAGKLAGAYGTPIADSVFVECDRLLDNEEFPSDGRFAVVHPDVKAVLIQDSNYTSREKLPNTNAIELATLGMIRGFQVSSDPRIVTTTSSGGSRWHNLAFHRSALALASVELPMPKSPHIQTAMVSLKDGEGQNLGVTMRLRAWEDPDEGTNKLVGDMLVGVKVLRSNGLICVRM